MFRLGPESSKFPVRANRKDRQRLPLSAPKKRSSRSAQLSFEPLESRQMLAADAAEIVGIVRTDLQGDGISNNDVVLAGATVTLYRDNGNGSYDSSDVQLASEATNSLGQYSFDGLEAGTYFVKVTLPPALQFKPGTDTQKVIISLAEAWRLRT